MISESELHKRLALLLWGVHQDTTILAARVLHEIKEAGWGPPAAPLPATSILPLREITAREQNISTTQCCPHPLSQHGVDGCLVGWGTPGRTGCACKNRGMADV